MLFGRSGSYNYSAIHVQVNSIPKGVTTHVQNKRSNFNRGYFFLGHSVRGDLGISKQSRPFQIQISNYVLYYLTDYQTFQLYSSENREVRSRIVKFPFAINVNFEWWKFGGPIIPKRDSCIPKLASLAELHLKFLQCTF